MTVLEQQYDDAMFAFSTGDLSRALNGLQEILKIDPNHFDAQLALGMVFSRMGDFESAIREGHKAERMRPMEPLAHTNLSMFYMKAGNRALAEHHGTRARMASWKNDLTPPKPGAADDPDLRVNQSSPKTFSSPPKLPDMPWKKNK